MNIQIAAVVLVFLVEPLTHMSPGQQAAGDPPRLAQEIPLSPKTSLTVSKEDIEAWRLKHPDQFERSNWTLVAYTFQFAGSENFMYATDHKEPNKSDIKLRCATRTLNPFKLATEHPQTKILEFGRPGGFKGKDGRDYSLMAAPRALTFFFELPTECKEQRLLLSITVQVGLNIKKTFEIDAGPFVGP